MTNVITLVEYCEKHGLDVERARRAARKHEWPDMANAPFKFGRLWAIDADAPAVSFPVGHGGHKRADGRQRYIIIVNDDELTAVNAMGIETINPRAVAALRRAKRAAANDAVEKHAAAVAAEYIHDGGDNDDE